MSMKKKKLKKHLIIFFLDDFHHGAINHVIHFFGFFLLGYGIGKSSILLIIASPFIMEIGHLYNFLSGKDREIAIKIIPLQLLAWLIFVGLGLVLSRFLI